MNTPPPSRTHSTFSFTYHYRACVLPFRGLTIDENSSASNNNNNILVDPKFDFDNVANSCHFGVEVFVVCKWSLAELTIFILSRNLQNNTHKIENWHTEYLCHGVYK